MNKNFQKIIKLLTVCNKPNKFKIPKKIKIILDNGPQYRYVDDIWYLTNEIQKETVFKYTLDINHFNKWYNRYLLITKEAIKFVKKIKYILKILENVNTLKLIMEQNLKINY